MRRVDLELTSRLVLTILCTSAFDLNPGLLSGDASCLHQRSEIMDSLDILSSISAGSVLAFYD